MIDNSCHRLLLRKSRHGWWPHFVWSRDLRTFEEYIPPHIIRICWYRRCCFTPTSLFAADVPKIIDEFGLLGRRNIVIGKRGDPAVALSLATSVSRRYMSGHLHEQLR